MSTLEKVRLKLPGLSLPKGIRPYRIDILIVIGLAIAIAISTYVGTYQIPNPIFTDFYAQDVWFGSDIPTVFGNITSFDSDFGRNNKHPLFPLIVFPVVFGLGKIFGLEPIAAVRLVIILTAILWIGSLYGLFRVMGCHRLDAILLSILGGTSAAAIFWLVVPESFPLGSLTIILGLIFVVLTQYRQFPLIWYVGVNVLTVSITITNSMVGILATFVNQSWKRIIQIGIVSLLVSTGLWILQRIVFTNAGFPFQPGTFIGEKKFISAPEDNNVLAAMSSFFYQTMVMPAVHFLNSPIRPDWVKLHSDTLSPASGGWFGMVAVLAWSALLVLGLWSFFTVHRHHHHHNKLRIVLGLTLFAQMALHSVYGAEETFIYTLHFVPLLLTLVAFSLLTPVRLISLSLIAILILSTAITNRAQFNAVTTNLWNYGTPRQQVEAQMKLRPSDPWPRNAGHVVLAASGSAVEQKAFYEPGGSFSPQVGSFGVSIWAVDSQGNLKATSDNIPLNEIQQRLLNTSGTDIPGIETETPYYQAAWNSPKPGTWRFTLKQAVNTDTKPVVLIRSVGPAGGEVQSLDWNGQRLLINQRWIVKNLPAQAKVYLGSERSPNWIHQTSTATQWQDDHGWAYARMELDSASPWDIEIEDLKPTAGSDLAIANPTSTPILNLPDAQFTDSFNAQIAHLRMSLVGNQTRPGDPVDYPLPRFRDGAYQLVALVRTGHLDMAKQLAPYFAATDFLNGTQPAADIPALGVWALTTLAEQVNQPDYDQVLWPDVHRKVGLILDLLNSNRPGYPIATSSEIPFSENPDFVRVELTGGKMDAIPGLITLDRAANFMSYRALLDAAALAERVGQSALAEQWRSQATTLRNAWETVFEPAFSQLDLTYSNGLWPSKIATANPAFEQGLENRWQAMHEAMESRTAQPQTSNFELAEAHQWLYLNQTDRVWPMLQQFWDHQASPGLYTWWSKPGANNQAQNPSSFSRWHRFRGWINASQVTPDYWTAAEMLLLQLDMLAYVDNSKLDDPTLVIGAGIPKEWLEQAFSVKGLVINGNIIDWAWDGKQINMRIQGKEMNVQARGGFPPNTPVHVVLTAKEA